MATTQVATESSPYPQSKGSTFSEGSTHVNRGRAWSGDIVRNWNTPITGVESLQERVDRYLLYFRLTPSQIKCIYDRFLAEMREGLEQHRAADQTAAFSSKSKPRPCSLSMTDTCVGEQFIPHGTERGVAYTLEFGGADLATAKAAKVSLLGSRNFAIDEEVTLNLKATESKDLPKGLLDRRASASEFFNSLAKLIQSLLNRDSRTTLPSNGLVPIAFTVGFPVEQRSIAGASLVRWVKGFETGRQTNDPVEGTNLGLLLDCALRRLDVPAQTRCIVNDTVSVLLTCAYETGGGNPPCRLGLVLGSGVNGCYIEPDASSYGYKGTIINCEFGSFDKSLPVNDIDLEVDFADVGTKGYQLFEKMTATTYLGELCRRLVVKVWQDDAPPLAWVRHSMPWLACARLIADQSAQLLEARGILKGLWDWEPSLEESLTTQELFKAVFERSAALMAIAIAALAKRTGRLQSAMGGLTCGIHSTIFAGCPFYREQLYHYLDTAAGAGLADLIKLHELANSNPKGSAILAVAAETLGAAQQSVDGEFFVSANLE